MPPPTRKRTQAIRYCFTVSLFGRNAGRKQQALASQVVVVPEAEAAKTRLFSPNNVRNPGCIVVALIRNISVPRLRSSIRMCAKSIPQRVSDGTYGIVKSGESSPGHPEAETFFEEE